MDSICVVYKAGFKRKIEWEYPAFSDDKNTLAKYVKNTGIALYTIIKSGLDVYRGEEYEKYEGFIVSFGEDEKEVFPYGNKAITSDGESDALRKAIGRAFSLGFGADEKAISLFSNEKIERLILKKSSTL